MRSLFQMYPSSRAGCAPINTGGISAFICDPLMQGVMHAVWDDVRSLTALWVPTQTMIKPVCTTICAEEIE